MRKDEASSRSGPRGRLEQSGTMRGYYREGKVFRPPMSAYEPMRPNDWMVDDFPDLLWPATVVLEHGAEAAAEFRALQDRFERRLGIVARSAEPMHGLDGRLTSLEAMDDVERRALKEAIADGTPSWVTPDSLRAAARNYPDLPGRWLLVDTAIEVQPEPADLHVLARALIDAVSDRHHKALVTSVPFGWLLRCGLIKLGDEELNLLTTYPNDPATMAMADAFILSSHLAIKAALEERDPEQLDARRAWNESFWTQNSALVGCVPEEARLEEENADVDDDDTVSSSIEAYKEALHESEAIATQIAAVFDSFLERALPPAVRLNLARPARSEVILGMVSRCARIALAMARSPHMWSGEHGTGALRSIVEAQIVLAWMRTQPDDVYEQYQRYGRGKRQLMKLKMDELADYFGADVPSFLSEARADFERKLGSEWSQQFQDVSIDSTFAGKSVRQMAEEAGLLELYRHIYQSASGVSHGEWWAVEDYAMQRCLNPLHAFHAIPSTDPLFPPTRDFGRALVSQLDDLIDEAADSLALAPMPESRE